MTAIWAAAGAGVASVTISLRALMLKPQARTWCDAPTPVRLAIAATGAIFGGVTVSLLHSDHAHLRETVAYGTTAISSLVLLRNMWRQRGQACGQREASPCRR